VTEGFRVPDRALTREIIAACGGLLRVTSANPSGEPAAVTAQDASVLARADSCDRVIDDGPADAGIASTVIRDGPDGWKVLREGGVTATMLSAASATFPRNNFA
jgi:tRNA A37 threonylcarbamoyladenosine synthetase subunit TsaC/SUA5/YrdC